MSFAALSSVIFACSTDPCEQHPESILCPGADDATGDGETGVPPGDRECIPFSIDDPAIGYEYGCQGTGNGWLVLDVFGSGTQPPECVNWGGDKPESPTTADCAPIDLTMLPNNVPAPGACCKDTAQSEQVVKQCGDDCAYAACNVAVAKLREAALALPHPDSTGVKKKAEERVRGDLFGLANKLELPAALDDCATLIIKAKGEPARVSLGAGDSTEKLLGHVDNATLTLQCSLDAIEPFVLNEGDVCDAPPNIPLVEGESTSAGIAAMGAVSVLGPEGEALTQLSNVTFEFREVIRHDQSIDFFLTSFEADAADARLGSLEILDPHIHLAAPVGAALVGDTVTFPAGTLRMEVSGVVMSEGELPFAGVRSSSVYVNTDVATVARTTDGGFAFVHAPFEVDDHTFVLSTEKCVAEVR